MVAEFRIFLLAVTSEFGMARDAVANDLQARDLQLRVQRSFRQEPGADTLLRLLHDYVRDCSAVVCVVGSRSGGCPSPAAAAAFEHLLPPGIAEASYTRWAFFLARAYQRRPTTTRTGTRRAATISSNWLSSSISSARPGTRIRVAIRGWPATSAC